MTSVLSLSDCLKSRYLTYNALLDAGFNTGQACICAEVLFGQADTDEHDTLSLVTPPGRCTSEYEPDIAFEPTEDDVASYLNLPVRLPPVCGGAPDDAERWADYERWLDQQACSEASHPGVSDEDMAWFGGAR